MHSVSGDNPGSVDRDSQERSVCNIGQTIATNLSGYYDAEKCRAHIANQIKVSKIDRFAAQISRALEVEASIQSRIGNILNMFVKHSAKVTHDFTSKCKISLQRHRQDRILNHSQRKQKPSKCKVVQRYQQENNNKSHHTISKDLLYGTGAQLVHTFLTQSRILAVNSKRKPPEGANQNREEILEDHLEHSSLSEDDYNLTDIFKPEVYVKNLGNLIKNNERKSRAIAVQLSTIRQLFERLASEHRDKVDIVYAAEEERQAATVIRRSAYNLSVAAIKATSTPVHVNFNNELNNN